jgi:hypothetical protein
MFKPLSSWFSSPLDNSKKSYSYSKNPSAIDWVVTTLISTIYKNIPFFHTTTKKKEEIKESVKEKDSGSEEDSESSSADSSSADSSSTDSSSTDSSSADSSSTDSSIEEKRPKAQGTPVSTTPPELQNTNAYKQSENLIPPPPAPLGMQIEEADPNNAIDKDDELQKLFPEPSEDKHFPQDYANNLHQFHQIIPKIKFSTTYNDDTELKHVQQKELTTLTIQEFKQPITSSSQLVSMTKKWLRFQEKMWGKDFDDICVVKKIEVENDQEQSLVTPEDTDAKIACLDLNTQSHSKSTVVRERNSNNILVLKKVLTEPACLKNLILMFGLKYSVMANMQFSGGTDGCCISKTIPLSDLNSAKNFYSCYNMNPSLVKIPLIHLAVEKGILPEVSFLLTADNVNCTSYQGIHLDEKQMLNREITLLILDTPLKIAIDNYDNAAVEILLQHQARLDISIRPNLSHRASQYGSFVNMVSSVESFTKLSDYFLTKTPKQIKETNSYIEIANLLYRSLPQDEEKSNFRDKADKKKLTIHSTLTNKMEYVMLDTLIETILPTKSARTLDRPNNGVEQIHDYYDSAGGATEPIIKLAGDHSSPTADSLAITKNSFCNLL